MFRCLRPTLAATCFSLAALLGATLLSARGASAAEIRGGETVVIKADETIADDLYVFGRQITIDGTIEGDLIAFGEKITINGTVKGDIAAAGQAVVLEGTADDARIAGQVLKLGPKAQIEGDVLAAGFSLETEPQSKIAGDALFAGAQALLAGQIDKDLKAGLGNLRLAGTIGGDADLEVGGQPGSDPIPNFGPTPIPLPTVPSGLTVADSATVTGKLNYLSPHEAQIDEGAKIGGINHTLPAPPAAAGPAAPPQNPYVAAALGRLRHVAGVLLVGLVVLVCFPRWSTEWADNIRTRPAASFFGGLAGVTAFIGLLILVVLAIVLFAVLAGLATLSELVPLIIAGGIVGYGAMIVLVWLFAAFLAEALTGLAIGRLKLADSSLATRIIAMIIGVVLLALVLSVPYAGALVASIVFLLGLGGFCLWLVGQREPQGAPVVASVPFPAAVPAKPMKS
jgi:cytoskeletal protein CcmA (bactofilin family)